MPALCDTVAYIRKAHAGQVDKAGMPYVGHPIRVHARLVEMWPDISIHSQHAALLHDVLEDTDIRSGDLREAGYSETTVFYVEWLTLTKIQRTIVPYQRFIECLCIGAPDDVLRIKFADNLDNADPQRLAMLSDGGSLARRYKRSLATLQRELHDRASQIPAKEGASLSPPGGMPKV